VGASLEGFEPPFPEYSGVLGQLDDRDAKNTGRRCGIEPLSRCTYGAVWCATPRKTISKTSLYRYIPTHSRHTQKDQLGLIVSRVFVTGYLVAYTPSFDGQQAALYGYAYGNGAQNGDAVLSAFAYDFRIREQSSALRPSDCQISQQETRRISTPRLNASLRFHLVPINVVVSYESQTIPHLGVGFPLRCFQRLSVPDLATRQCHWRDSRQTRGQFIPVLSY
jgi:hypothetical protein